MVKVVFSCAAALMLGAIVLSLGGCGDEKTYSGPALPYTPEPPKPKEQTPPVATKKSPPRKPHMRIEPKPPAAKTDAEKPAEPKPAVETPPANKAEPKTATPEEKKP